MGFGKIGQGISQAAQRLAERAREQARVAREKAAAAAQAQAGATRTGPANGHTAPVSARTPSAAPSVDRLEARARQAPVVLEAGPRNQFSPATFKERMEGLKKEVAEQKLRGLGVDLGDLLSKLNPFDDRVVIFDNFGEGVTHGDDVEAVLQDNAGVEDGEIRRIGTGATPPPPGASLEERVEHRAVSFLDSTSDAMERVLGLDGGVDVINQSQSISPVRVADEMWRAASGDPEKKADLAEELGLPRDAEDGEILQALVDTVDRVFEESGEIAEAKERYDGLSDRLEERGIMHVVTAGNTGRFLDTLDRRGVTYDGDFTDSVLFNDNVLVVAAANGGAEDGIAGFSTPSDHVDVAIDGTDIEVEGGRDADGTSFAAPQVTALIAELRRINPDLTNDEIREIIAEASTDTAATDREEGAGILDPDRALELARESLVEEPRRRIAG